MSVRLRRVSARSRTWVLPAALVGLIALVAYGALGGRPGPPFGSTSQATGAAITATVTADTRTISSVLVLDAAVVANPIVRIPAPSDGIVERRADGCITIRAVAKRRAELVPLPPSSTVVNLLVMPGTKVRAGLPIVDVQYAGFALQASLPPEKMYRLYGGILSAQGEITNGPGPFPCRILGVPFPPGTGIQIAWEPPVASDSGTAPSTGASSPAASVQAGEADARVSYRVGEIGQGVIVLGSTPSALRLIEGLPGLLAIRTAEASGVVALPVQAVAGVSQRGQVYVVSKGVRVVREVTLGITDGTYIQIVSGLRAGEVVALPSPSIANLREAL